MKIIALIADDRAPEGREETFIADKYNMDLKGASEQIERTIRRYNATLRNDDLPRRLLSLKLEECNQVDTLKLGRCAFDDGRSIDVNYWPKGHALHEEWRMGYLAAEGEYIDMEDEDEGDIVFDEFVASREMDRIRTRVAEAFFCLGMSLGGAQISFSQAASSATEIVFVLKSSMNEADQLVLLASPLNLKQTAWERRNPNAPWWRLFERRRRA
jgi:hypothetical protein